MAQSQINANLELYNKLKENPKLTTNDLAQLRESLGISVYNELEEYLATLSDTELFDHLCVLCNAISTGLEGTRIVLEIEDDDPLNTFIQQFNIFNLNPSRLRTVIAKSNIRPKRKKEEMPIAAEVEESLTEEQKPTIEVAPPIPGVPF